MQPNFQFEYACKVEANLNYTNKTTFYFLPFNPGLQEMKIKFEFKRMMTLVMITKTLVLVTCIGNFLAKICSILNSKLFSSQRAFCLLSMDTIFI